LQRAKKLNGATSIGQENKRDILWKKRRTNRRKWLEAKNPPEEGGLPIELAGSCLGKGLGEGRVKKSGAVKRKEESLRGTNRGRRTLLRRRLQGNNAR